MLSCHLKMKLIITDFIKYATIALLALYNNMHSLNQQFNNCGILYVHRTLQTLVSSFRVLSGCECNSLYFEMNIGTHGCLLSF